ncbi:MAG: LacI family DNA-binding transcriptional regulator [Actinomycetota bacterium]
MPQRSVTLEHVAIRAGVSRQTVSRAINGRAEIRRETRDRVLQAAAELGYEPNAFARGLVTDRSDTIGLVVGDITNPFFPDVARAVMEEAEARDLVALVCNLGLGWDTLKPLRALSRRGVDGYILFPAAADRDRVLAFAETHGPVVAVDAPYANASMSTIAIDWTSGAEAAARHLAAGSNAVAVLGAMTEHASSARVDAFCREAVRLGLRVSDETMVADEMTFAGGRRAALELLDRGGEFDAVFAFNDLMALGAMQTVAEAGIRVPDECRIVGCDDIELASYATPTLSSLRVDRSRLGTLAMHELHRRIAEPDAPPAHHTVEVTLVDRRSSRAGHA